jgi:hypothetical protein
VRLAVAEAAESFVVLAEAGKCDTVARGHSCSPLLEKAGTVLGVTAHAVQSVPVAHVKAPVVAAVRLRHIAVGRHRWCGGSEAPVRPGYGIAFHLATGGVSEETAAAVGAQAIVA